MLVAQLQRPSPPQPFLFSFICHFTTFALFRSFNLYSYILDSVKVLSIIAMDYTPHHHRHSAMHARRNISPFTVMNAPQQQLPPPSAPSPGELPTRPLPIGSPALLSNDLAVRAILYHFGEPAFYGEDTFCRERRVRRCLRGADEKLAREWRGIRGFGMRRGRRGRG